MASNTVASYDSASLDDPTDEKNRKKRAYNRATPTIKSIFESSNCHLEKKFRNSRKMTIDPPDPSILEQTSNILQLPVFTKLNRTSTNISPVNTVNKLPVCAETRPQTKDVHDEITDIFNMSAQKSAKTPNTTAAPVASISPSKKSDASPSKKPVVVSSKVDEPKLSSEKVKVKQPEPLVYVKKEKLEFSTDDSSQATSETCDDNDDDEDSDDFELVMQLNKSLAKETRSKQALAYKANGKASNTITTTPSNDDSLTTRTLRSRTLSQKKWVLFLFAFQAANTTNTTAISK